MQFPSLTLLTLSTLATLSASTPVDNALPLPAVGAAKPATLPAVGAALPAVGSTKPTVLPATAPRISSDNSVPDTSSASTPAILSYLRSTITEVRKHTLNINNTLASVNRLDLNFVTQKTNAIIQIRTEVTVICYSITQLNSASISRWTDSIADVPSVRAQLLAGVQELVWEIVFTLRGAESKLQSTIWDLLGTEALVLLATLGQLLTILNVFVDGIMKLALGLLNTQIAVLTGVFSGLYAYAIDIAGGLFASVTKLLSCLLS